MRFLTRIKSSQALFEIRKIVSFGAGEGLARGLNWGMMALLPLILSSGEYGRVGLLLSIEILVANVSMVGMDRAILRFYANHEEPNKILKSVILIWAIVAWIPLVVVIVMLLGGRNTFFTIPLAPHLIFLSVGVALSNLNGLCVCIGRAQLNLGIFLKFRLSYIILKSFLVLLVAYNVKNSFSYVIGMSIAVLTMAIFVVPFLWGKARGSSDRVIVNKLLIFGSPFVFHLISGNVLNYFSRFFLVAYNSIEDVGLFTFSYTLGSGVFIGFAILSSYFEPRIYNYSDDRVRCEKWLYFYTGSCIALASFGGAFLLLVFPYLSGYFPEDYDGALPVISMIMGTVMLRPLYLQGVYRLTSNQKTAYIAIASLLGAILSVGLNFILIPQLGIKGAAMSLYAGSAVVCVFVLISSLLTAGVSIPTIVTNPMYVLCVMISLFLVLGEDSSIADICALLLVAVTCSLMLVCSFRSIDVSPDKE